MRGFLPELRYALRTLSRSPGFAATAVATLALGIGATTAVYSVVHAVLWKPLPFRQPDRLTAVWESDLHNREYFAFASFPDLQDWKVQSRSFAGLGAWRRPDMNLTEPGRQAERISVAAISHDLFPLLGVAPALGRGLTPGDDREGAAGAVLLSHALWRTRYGQSPSILGRALAIDGLPTTVIGVMPEGFEYPAGAQAWIALTPTMGAFLHERGVHGLRVVGRLADGVSIEAAGAEMAAIAARLARAYPDQNAGRSTRVQPLAEAMVGDFRRELYVLLAAVVAVTLVGCANVSGLLLARARARAREVAIRRALGAGRAGIAAPLLTEVLLLAAAGAGAGMLLASWGVQGLLRLSPAALPRTGEIRLDLPVLFFTLATSLAAGIASAAAPLFGMLRGSESPLDGLGSRTAPREILRSAMVVGQVALACLLVTAAGLLMMSLRNLRHVDPGFRSAGLLTAEIQLPKSTYPEPARTADFYNWPEVQRFYAAILPRLSALPGAAAAAVAVNHPLMPGWTSQVEVEGRPQVSGKRDEVFIRPVAPGYFRAVSVPVKRGRDLDDRDRAGSEHVILVNEAFARRYFGRRDAVGRIVSFWGRPRQVVGVVGDERFLGPSEEAAPAIYPSLLQVPMSSLAVVVRAPADQDPVTLLPGLRQALSEVDPGVALFHVRTADALLEESVGSPRFRATLLSLFGCIALLLSAIGLYGLLAYTVARRTREIGIRVALGARPGDVARLVLRQGLFRCLAGLVLGGAAALLTTRLLSRFLFGVAPLDSRILVTVAGLLLATAAAASYFPTRRAMQVDPSAALKTE
jgi:predicted permease